MTNYPNTTATPQVVYAWDGQVEFLRSEINRLRTALKIADDSIKAIRDALITQHEDENIYIFVTVTEEGFNSIVASAHSDLASVQSQASLAEIDATQIIRQFKADGEPTLGTFGEVSEGMIAYLSKAILTRGDT